jgi:hypothetical protein
MQNITVPLLNSYYKADRVGKNPGFLKKAQPGGFFWVLMGFVGFYWFYCFFGT